MPGMMPANRQIHYRIIYNASNILKLYVRAISRQFTTGIIIRNYIKSVYGSCKALSGNLPLKIKDVVGAKRS